MNLLDIENALIDLAAKVRAERTKPGEPVPNTGLPSLPPLGPSNPLIPNIPGMTPTPLPSGSDPAPAPTGGAPAGYEGHELTKGHPRINVEYAGNAGVYSFTGPGTVYYQVVSGTDSGMRVTSWITKVDGTPVYPRDTRVISNKQPYQVFSAEPYLFYVVPEQTGPISVGLE